MNFNVIRNPEQLNAYQKRWNELQVHSPFQTFEWVHGYSRQLSELSDLCIVHASSPDGDWLGVAPMFIENGLQRNLRPFPFGNGLDKSNFWITSKDSESEFCRHFFSLLSNQQESQKLIGAFDSILLDHVDRFSPEMENLVMPFQQAGYRVRYKNMGNRWSYSLPETYEDFELALPEDLAFRASYLLEFVDEQIETRSTSDSSIQQLWAEFKTLKVAVEPELEDMFANDQSTFWLGKAIQELAEKGLAEIRINYLGAGPVSGVVLLGEQSHQTIYQSAVSPFCTLSGVREWTILEAIRHSISKGFRTLCVNEGLIDFYASWNAEVMPLSRARFVAPTLAARIKDSIVSSGQAILGSVFSTN